MDPPTRAPLASVLFVCMGNICRSPTAEAVFRRLAEDAAPELTLRIDSAGTHGYHVGASPDPRSQAAARRRGIDMSALRARRLVRADFERFDYVLVMDERNREDALEIAPASHPATLRLFLEYAPTLGRLEVPDPYYGGETGFEEVLDLVEEASRGLLDELRSRAARGAAPR
jgi:protein-tyrosine phosphatase